MTVLSCEPGGVTPLPAEDAQYSLPFEDTLDFQRRSLPLFGGEVIDQSDMPEHLGSARAAVCASDELIRHADRNTPRRRYRNWTRYKFYYPSDDNGLEGMMVGKWKLVVFRLKEGAWLITRSHCSRHGVRGQSLYFLLGPALVYARSCDAAKRLAVYSQLTPPERSGGLVWLDGSELEWWVNKFSALAREAPGVPATTSTFGS
jgi:hypothetical protein